MRSIVLALVLTATPGLALAADGPGCGAYSLTGGEKSVGVVDNPPAGKSIGDTRAGWRKLLELVGRQGRYGPFRRHTDRAGGR